MIPWLAWLLACIAPDGEAPTPPHGTVAYAAGSFEIVDVSPDRAVLRIDGESFSLVAGPQWVKVHDVASPRAAVVGNLNTSGIVWVGGGRVQMLQGKPGEQCDAALTPSHGALLCEGNGVTVTVVDFDSGRTHQVNGMEPPRLWIHGIAPDGETVAVASPAGGVGAKLFALDVVRGGAVVQRLEVLGLAGASRVSAGPHRFSQASVFGYPVRWAKEGGQWTVVALDGCCTIAPR